MTDSWQAAGVWGFEDVHSARRKRAGSDSDHLSIRSWVEAPRVLDCRHICIDDDMGLGANTYSTKTFINIVLPNRSSFSLCRLSLKFLLPAAVAHSLVTSIHRDGIGDIGKLSQRGLPGEAATLAIGH